MDRLNLSWVSEGQATGATYGGIIFSAELASYKASHCAELILGFPLDLHSSRHVSK